MCQNSMCVKEFSYEPYNRKCKWIFEIIEEKFDLWEVSTDKKAFDNKFIDIYVFDISDRFQVDTDV